MPEPATQRLAKPAARVTAARVLKWIAAALLILLLLPYLLVPLYRIVDPVSTPMLWRWITGARVERQWMPLERIARVLPRTVVAAEDARFCAHPGVDFRTLRELLEDIEAVGDLGEVRGGSTITQQLAKNLFLWQGRSYLRKALELPLALWIDLVISKARQMEIYLNVVAWGPNGEFGAEAGARRAFGKSAAMLNAREAALMAAVLPSPVRRNAQKPSPALRRLAGVHEGRAARNPTIDSCLARRQARVR